MTNTQIVLTQLSDLENAATDLCAEYQAAQQRQPPPVVHETQRQEADVVMCHWLSAWLLSYWLINGVS